MTITLSRVSKSFDGCPIVRDIDLEIRSGEMFFLLGPSGCGKTTLLRMLAGFSDPDQGDIRFGEKRMNGVPPHQRHTALVFQNYAVWPHLTVFENVAYGLRVRRISEPDLSRRVNEALALVKLETLARRKPASLSGGQQQRVALARAVVVNPDVLLFDEPLSNLDAKLRLELRDEIRRIHTRQKATSVYVTHDQEEALSLAGRIAVMNAGILQQVGAPQDIYHRPANPFVAGFIGECNLYPADSAIGRALGAPPGGTVGFRPEHVTPAGAAGGNAIEATVLHAAYLGSKSQAVLQTPAGQEIKAWLPDHPRDGDSLRLTIDPARLLKFN